MNLQPAERLVRDVLEPVVEELLAVDADLPPVMVVGAVARDALHATCGHTTDLRATDDLDIALAVGGWDTFDTIVGRLVRVPSASSEIRFSIAGVIVDLVPFGLAVETPDGVVTPERRKESISVFGFQDVLAHAHRIRLDSGVHAYLPTVAGYTVLKLKAWADRSTGPKNYKDAPDLACAMYWYQNPTGVDSVVGDVRDRLYETEQGQAHLIAADLDEPVATVRLLIDDALSLLTPGRRLELREVWESGVISDELLAAYLANSSLPGWPRGGDDRLLRYSRAVRSVITGPSLGVSNRA